MVQKIDRQELQMLFLEALNGADYRYIEGLNPFRILLNGTEYWIYIKNLTSAHFDNPDVWRAQLPQRDDFNPIKESEADFILLGYDKENDVYASWNPLWVKQRLNSTENVSFYSRLSLQQQARTEKQFKRMELSNEGEVIVFPREFIRMFFINVKSYFLAEGDFVAIGSKRRPEANEAFKTFTDMANVTEFARYLGNEGLSQDTIGNYCWIIKNLISDGTIARNRKLFYAYDSLEDYRMAIGQFVILEEVREKNEKWNDLISAALTAYIGFLTRDVSDDISSEGLFPLVEEEMVLENTQGEDAPTAGSVLNDWEGKYTNANGKLTRIANPELIDQLRGYLDTEYPKKAAAFNVVERFYGDRFPNMTLADWGRLMNDINWADPYVLDNLSKPLSPPKYPTASGNPKRCKTHVLRVEFPDGTVFQDKNASETYAKAIKKIDPELVALVELSHAGVDVVSKELNAKYARDQKPIGDGWYVMTNSATVTKYSDLKTISDALELGLVVDLVPLDGVEITDVLPVEIATDHEPIRGIENSSGEKPVERLAIREKVLKEFVYKVVLLFNEKDKLVSFLPFLKESQTQNVQLFKEGSFRLTGMFLCANHVQIRNRNRATQRWFETPFIINGREMYLSTQWYGNGNYSLMYSDFRNLILDCYGDRYRFAHNSSGAFEFWVKP